MNKTDDQLKADIARNDVRSDRSAWVIVAGLVAEAGIALLTGKPLGDAITAVLTNGAIALGVYGEIHFGRKATAAREELQRRSGEKIAEFNRAAEADRLARLKIEERLAPRAMTPEQQRALADELAVFKGQRVYLVASPSTSETEVFMRVLACVLEWAGWELVGTNSASKPLFIFPAGVIVQWFVPKDADPMTSQDVKPSIELAAGLNKLGILATATGGPMQSMGAITVVINTKE